MKRIKIAYLTINDPLDKRSWSGITYYLGQSLVKHVGDVDFIGPVAFPRWIDLVLRGMANDTMPRGSGLLLERVRFWR